MQRFDRKMKQHWCGVTELSENTGADNKKHSSSFVEQMEKEKKMQQIKKKWSKKLIHADTRKREEKPEGDIAKVSLSTFMSRLQRCLSGKVSKLCKTWLSSTTALNPVQKTMAICSVFFFFHILFCCKCHKIHKQNGNLIFQQRIKHNPTARSLQCTAAKGTLSDFGNSLQLPFGFLLLVSMGKGVR